MAGRTMRESVERALAMNVDDFVDAMSDDSMTVQDRIAVAMCAEAMGGNFHAFKAVADALGSQEAPKPNTNAKVTPYDRIAKQRAAGPARKPNAEVPRSA